MGKKNRLMMGHLLLLLSNSGYAMISYMPKSDWRYFYALSAAMRMMQGYADLIIYNSSYSLISNNFIENRRRNKKIIIISFGLGIPIGPTIGLYIFIKYNFAVSFFFYSFLIFLVIFSS